MASDGIESGSGLGNDVPLGSPTPKHWRVYECRRRDASGLNSKREESIAKIASNVSVNVAKRPTDPLERGEESGIERHFEAAGSEVALIDLCGIE